MLQRGIIFIAIMYTMISSSRGAKYVLFKICRSSGAFCAREINCAINMKLLRSFQGCVAEVLRKSNKDEKW